MRKREWESVCVGVWEIESEWERERKCMCIREKVCLWEIERGRHQDWLLWCAYQILYFDHTTSLYISHNLLHHASSQYMLGLDGKEGSLGLRFLVAQVRHNKPLWRRRLYSKKKSPRIHTIIRWRSTLLKHLQSVLGTFLLCFSNTASCVLDLELVCIRQHF